MAKRFINSEPRCVKGQKWFHLQMNILMMQMLGKRIIQANIACELF